MKEHLRMLLHDEAAARQLAEHGLRTLLQRHTCAHRVDELLRVYRSLEPAERTIAVDDRMKTASAIGVAHA